MKKSLLKFSLFFVAVVALFASCPAGPANPEPTESAKILIGGLLELKNPVDENCKGYPIVDMDVFYKAYPNTSSGAELKGTQKEWTQIDYSIARDNKSIQLMGIGEFTPADWIIELSMRDKDGEERWYGISELTAINKESGDVSIQLQPRVEEKTGNVEIKFKTGVDLSKNPGILSFYYRNYISEFDNFHAFYEDHEVYNKWVNIPISDSFSGDVEDVDGKGKVISIKVEETENNTHDIVLSIKDLPYGYYPYYFYFTSYQGETYSNSVKEGGREVPLYFYLEQNDIKVENTLTSITDGTDDTKKIYDGEDASEDYYKPVHIFMTSANQEFLVESGYKVQMVANKLGFADAQIRWEMWSIDDYQLIATHEGKEWKVDFSQYPYSEKHVIRDGAKIVLVDDTYNVQVPFKISFGNTVEFVAKEKKEVDGVDTTVKYIESLTFSDGRKSVEVGDDTASIISANFTAGEVVFYVNNEDEFNKNKRESESSVLIKTADGWHTPDHKLDLIINYKDSGELADSDEIDLVTTNDSFSFVIDDYVVDLLLQPNKIDVKYDAKGNLLEYNATSTAEYSLEKETLSWNKQRKISSEKPSAQGYVFELWSDKENNKKYESGASLEEELKNPAYPDLITLTAQWKPAEATLKFVYKAEGKETINKEGATSKPSGSVEDTTLTYDKPYTLPELSAEGYTFDGWKITKNDKEYPKEQSALNEPIEGGKPITSDKTTTYFTEEDRTEDGKIVLTATAQWSVNEYTVTFNKNTEDSVILSKESIPVKYDDKYGELATANRTGYTFNGWFTAASGGSLVTKDTTVSITANQTLYAQWTANTYTIQFDSNGGEGTTKSVTATYGVNATLTANGFSRTGYTFSKWNTKADGSGTDYKDKVTVKDLATEGYVTLYAQWTANTYTIQFDSNGGTGATESVAATYGVNATLTANGFSRTGYIFSKWNTKADGSGTDYQDKATVKDLATEGNVTLYAQWTLIDYTITYELNGGTASNPASYNIESETFDLSNPVRSGYIFSGWTWEGQNTPSKTVTISKGSTGNKVYIANWIIDSAEPEIESGIFSVGAGKKVKFSSGNLQAVYDSENSDYTWRFAPTQLDFAGEKNNTISDPTEGTIIDLFGWSTTTDSLYGMSYEEDTNYSGEFCDWGNVIDSNWFTLSKDEWAYLIGERTVNGGTGEGSSYQRAEVDSVYGFILYPDTYNKQTGAVSYTAEEWAEMESDGCIFLPSAGNRWGNMFFNKGSDEFLISDYWSSTPCGEGEAYNFTFNINDVGNVYHSDRPMGYSVRLVTLVTE